MDKYQEALNNVKRFYVESDHYDKEDIKLLQELVDKATPKKPLYSGRPADIQQYCPTCHIRVANIKYCWNCGQALDWSDGNDK